MSSLLLLLLMAICASTTTKNNNRKEETPKTMQAPPLCYGGGIPGMHGKPGSAGAPGRDGRDGRDGAKGDQGLPGKIGSQGPPGAVGPAGEKGHHGARGEPGVQGPPGQIGDGGPLPFKNWKECAWKNLDIETEKGLIKDCVFTKNHTDTALHVYWSGAFRLAGCNNCCRRWYFTFNGAECSAPLPIDGIVYLDTSSNHNPHRVRHVEGHCNGIHKGKVRVGFWVGTCERYSQAGSAYTGYRSVSRIFIEEVPKAQA